MILYFMRFVAFAAEAAGQAIVRLWHGRFAADKPRLRLGREFHLTIAYGTADHRRGTIETSRDNET
jgi:hypothetical protein